MGNETLLWDGLEKNKQTNKQTKEPNKIFDLQETTANVQ